MNLIKSGFPRLHNLTDFFDDGWMHSKLGNGNWSPAINTSSNEDSYEIEVAAPGLKKEDFRVEVNNHMITISGKTEKEEEEKNKNYTQREFSSKSFTRSFMLPEDVTEEKVTAKYKEGILLLTLKKTVEKLPPKKEVPIR